MVDDQPPEQNSDASHAEAEELRRERDALAARVAALEARQRGRRRLWRPVVAILVVIGTLSFTLSAVGWWARRNVADTEVWLERVGPLAGDAAVQEALGTWLSDEVTELVDLDALFVDALPERGQILATPLAGAVEDFVRARIDRFLESDRFEQLWLDANELAHRAAVRVLRGDSDAIQGRRDTVVINLVPVINAALADLGRASPELLGREIDLPDVTVDDLPDAAISRLEQAFGVDLGDDFGQFVVYDHGRLTALQDAIDQARRWLYAVSAITVVTMGGALWLSGRRRRTLMQVLVGLAVGTAVIRRIGVRGQSELLSAIPGRVNRAAAEAASDQFLDPLLAVTQTLLIVLAVLAVGAAVSGPYPWAVWLRHHAVKVAGDLAQGARGAGAGLGGSGWLSAHRSGLQFAGVAIVVLVLLVVDLSFFGLAVLAALVALGGVALSRIPAPAGAE